MKETLKDHRLGPEQLSCRDKFITFKFFEFNMKDVVSFMDQVHEFMIRVFKFKNPDVEISEKFIGGAIITKLTPLNLRIHCHNTHHITYKSK